MAYQKLEKETEAGLEEGYVAWVIFHLFFSKFTFNWYYQKSIIIVNNLLMINKLPFLYTNIKELKFISMKWDNDEKEKLIILVEQNTINKRI